MLNIIAAALIAGSSITPTTLTAVCTESPALALITPSSPQVFEAMKDGQCKIIGPYQQLVFVGFHGDGSTGLAYEVVNGRVIQYWINPKDFKQD